uniref:Uncharacterized protein n=1 Tax=Oryza nivara TaxID=4536 RepID=A0A0E0HN93_ORYNI
MDLALLASGAASAVDPASVACSVGGKRDGVHGGSGIGGMRGGIAGVRGNVSGGRGDVNGRSHNISSIICVGGGRDSVGYRSRRGW